LGRQQHREVGGLLALENAAGVEAGLAVAIGGAGVVAYQSSNPRKLSRMKDSRHRILCSETNKSFPSRREQRITSRDERVDSLFRKARKSSVEFIDCTNVRHMDCAAPDADRVLGQFHDGATGSRGGVKIVGIKEEAKHFGTRNQVVKQLQSLLNKFGGQHGDAGDISAWPVEAGDK